MKTIIVIIIALLLPLNQARATDSFDMQGTKALSPMFLESIVSNEGGYVAQMLPSDWAIIAADNSTQTTTSRTLYNSENKHIYSISYTCAMTEQVGLIEMMDANIRTGDIGKPEKVLLRFMKNNRETYSTEAREVKERWYAPRNTKEAIQATQKADQLSLVFIANNEEYKTITISLTGSTKAIETARKQCK